MKITSLLRVGGLAAFALVAVPTLSAQDKPAKMSPDARVDKMKTELGLTDDQATKIKAIYASKETELAAVRADKSLTKEQRREKMKPIMDDIRKQTSEVLTPEQKAKVKQGGKKPKEG